MEQRAFGAIFSPKDVRDYRIACATNATFPKEFELEMPEVKDQGSVGSCVAHSIATVIEYYSRLQDDEHGEMSVGYIYGNRKNSTHKGYGMITRQAIAATCEYGDVVKSLFPFNEEVPTILDKFEEKESELFPMGKQHRFSSYYRCDNETEIKTALMKNSPVIFAMNWYRDIEVVDGVMVTTAQNKGGAHCMVIYGWNGTGWKIQNSWGTDWGVSGRAILPYDVPIIEAFGVTDDISRKQKIEELEESNEELLNKIKELNNSIATTLDDVYLLLTDEQLTSDIVIERVEELKQTIRVIKEQLDNSQNTIEKQAKEIERLTSELTEIKKPFHTNVGKLVAGLVNFLISAFSKISNK